jgi:hypothetical protein
MPGARKNNNAGGRTPRTRKLHFGAPNRTIARRRLARTTLRTRAGIIMTARV